MTKLIVCAIAGALASQAATITYDLESDFSDTSNPNGIWSFVQGSAVLSPQAQPADGNALDPAAANGMLGFADNFSTAPFVFQASQDGSSTAPYSDNDFLAGNVLAHSPNSGAPLSIEWTAPEAGTITFSGDVWYAHSPVDRSNDYTLAVNGGTDLASGTVSSANGENLSDPSTFSSSTSISVNEGDVLALDLSRTAGQEFGSLAGVNLTVDLTPNATPEPRTTLLFAAGLIAIAAAMKQRLFSSRS